MMGGATHLPGAGSAYLRLLRGLALRPDQRPWHRRELHNPWSRAATGIDAWTVLDCCMALGRLPEVADRIDSDVILFDTALLPDRWDDADQGPMLFPVDPVDGLTILCALGDGARIVTTSHGTIALAPGDLALIPAGIEWRPEGDTPLFAAGYFPAASRYIRDPGHPAQLALMERLPLFNFATMPLWLVAGEDRADNDFVTGFAPRSPYWSAPPDLFDL